MAKSANVDKPTSGDLEKSKVSKPLSVHPILFFLQIAMVVLTTKALSNLLPAELYFSFRALLFDAEARVAPFAVLIKIGTPLVTALLVVVAGFAVDKAMNSRELMPTVSTVVLTMQTAGFAVAMLLSWPMIVHWDVLADSNVTDRRTAFFVVYGLYAATYFYAAGVGAKLAYKLRGVSTSDILDMGAKWTSDAVLAAVTAITATSIQAWLGLV